MEASGRPPPVPDTAAAQREQSKGNRSFRECARNPNTAGGPNLGYCPDGTQDAFGILPQPREQSHVTGGHMTTNRPSRGSLGAPESNT